MRLNAMKPARVPISAWALLLLILSGSGCASVLPLSDLPEDSIALVYWKSEDGRRRLELRGESSRKTPFAFREGIAELGRVNKLFADAETISADLRYPGHLMLLDPRTLELTRVEQAPLGSRPLAWSADHRYLLFGSDRISGRHQVYELDTQTGEVRATTSGRSHYVAAAYGPGQKVALGRIAPKGEGAVAASITVRSVSERERVAIDDVAVRHLDCANDQDLVVFVPRSISSPEANRRAMVTVQELQSGAEPRSLAVGEHPVFSSDGEWIVYSAPFGPQGKERRLRRMRADGSGRTRLGDGVRSEETPAISPDGNFVVYVSRHNGLDRLFVKRFDGTGDRLLFDDGVVSRPIW